MTAPAPQPTTPATTTAQAALAPAAPFFVERGTHRLRYEVHGSTADAPPVLLVMGMAFASSAWDTLPAALVDAGFRVVTYDNRGTGGSSLPRGWFRMRELADDAAAVLDATGLASAHVFGISMGGMTAMELALRHRQRVRSLALGCTFANYLKSKKPALSIMRRVFGSALRAGRGDHVDYVAPVLVADSTITDPSERARFADWLPKVGRTQPSTIVRQMIAVARHAADARLRQLDLRTLVITGDVDRLVPPQNSAHLARIIPGAQLVEVRGAGHCFPFERLDETRRALTRFFLDEGRATGAAAGAAAA